MKINFNAPINTVSFGNVSYNFLKCLIDKKVEMSYFPIGQVNASAFEVSEPIHNFLSSDYKNLNSFDRNDVTLKLWHINGLLESYTNKRVAMTFHETSEVTNTEKNILNSLDATIVTSSYTKEVFDAAGVKNVNYIPLGFDGDHFKKINTPKMDTVNFGLFGKMESRKNTLRILRNWAEVFGNKKDYRLNCAITNPFLDINTQKAMIAKELNGNIPWNINFLPFQEKLTEYNLILNSIDIDLTSMSSCEGFNLPAFQAICLGKVSVMLDAHAHKDYKSDVSCVLVPSSGMRPAIDGIFFHKGAEFNQGEWFDFKDEDFKDALWKSVEVLQTTEKSIFLENALKIKEKFSYSASTDKILEILKSI